jgi:hypothetical protein
MFAWWKNSRLGASSKLPCEGPGGTLNSKLPLKASGEFTRLQPKTEIKRNQCSRVLGTSLGATEVATEPTTAPATDCPSVEVTEEEPMIGTCELDWAFPKPLPPTQDFNQDVVRVWSAHAPPARRQPKAQEHAVELLQALQRQPCLVGKWILATDLESAVYPQLLQSLGWAPRPWTGRNGVAKHLGLLTQRRYKRVEVAGSTRNWAAFFVPATERRGSRRTGLNTTSRQRTC